jgi:hypothetical protein
MLLPWCRFLLESVARLFSSTSLLLSYYLAMVVLQAVSLVVLGINALGLLRLC